MKLILIAMAVLIGCGPSDRGGVDCANHCRIYHDTAESRSFVDRTRQCGEETYKISGCLCGPGD